MTQRLMPHNVITLRPVSYNIITQRSMPYNTHIDLVTIFLPKIPSLQNYEALSTNQIPEFA